MKAAHPLADEWPLMPDAELEALAEDIRVNGQVHPVETWRGLIIDGRNRYRAIRIFLHRAEEEVWFREFVGEEEQLAARIDALNLHRRHLTAGQRACVAASRVLNCTKTYKLTRGEAAKKFGVAESYIGQAIAIYYSYKQLFEQVRSGEKMLSEAYAWKLKQGGKRVAEGTEGTEGTDDESHEDEGAPEDLPAPERRAQQPPAPAHDAATEAPCAPDAVARSPGPAPDGEPDRSGRGRVLIFGCTDEDDDLGEVIVRVEVSSRDVRVGCPICLLSLDHPVARDRHRIVSS